MRIGDGGITMGHHVARVWPVLPYPPARARLIHRLIGTSTMSYNAPVKDMLFVLKELAGIDAVAQLPGF
ncbi:acyl-CoA dehydrogenase N-terminal domain-containing protein, partial [Burkholderia seminalis]|uniref:acyl-CoA dehydrogenase N-terminal domain-containing protein n=1 Tax=Burkholderia seminalis TaxID=488731 RepID=UPI0021AB90FD